MAIVTAAGYPGEADRFEERVAGLIAAFKRQRLPISVTSRSGFSFVHHTSKLLKQMETLSFVFRLLADAILRKWSAALRLSVEREARLVILC